MCGLILKWWIVFVVIKVIFVSFFVFGLLLIYVLVIKVLLFGSSSVFMVFVVWMLLW